MARTLCSALGISQGWSFVCLLALFGLSSSTRELFVSMRDAALILGEWQKGRTRLRLRWAAREGKPPRKNSLTKNAERRLEKRPKPGGLRRENSATYTRLWETMHFSCSSGCRSATLVQHVANLCPQFLHAEWLWKESGRGIGNLFIWVTGNKNDLCARPTLQ